MNKQESETIEIELGKNTEVLENTFSHFNLKVLSVAYSVTRHDGYITAYIELVSVNGNKLKLPRDSYADEINVKMNFYNNGRLLCSDSIGLEKSSFNGYDTLEKPIYVDNLIERVTNIRIFATL